MIRLPVAVLPGGDGVPILGTKPRRETLGIDEMEGLKTTVMGRAAHNAPITDGNTPAKREEPGVVTVSHLLVSLAEVPRTADCDEEPGAHGNSFTEALLCRPTMVMKPHQ